MNSTFLNTVLLGGSTEDKLRAARRAGFDLVELWTKDVAAMPTGVAGARQLAADLTLGFVDYQVLLDFDGAPGVKREEKRAEAISMLDTAAALGASMVLAPASTNPDCDEDRIGVDLAWLAAEAGRRGLRIAYEGMAWSTVNHSIPTAWAAIEPLDPLVIGLVVDSYHLFVTGGRAVDIANIPPARIFLVQFADVMGPVLKRDYKEVARHDRLLPGKGNLPLLSLARQLADIGYDGPVGLEVFNDRLHQRPPEAVANEAKRALNALLAR